MGRWFIGALLLACGCHSAPSITPGEPKDGHDFLVWFPENAASWEIRFERRPQGTLLWHLEMPRENRPAFITNLDYGVIPSKMIQRFPGEGVLPDPIGQDERVAVDLLCETRSLPRVTSNRRMFRRTGARFVEE